MFIPAQRVSTVRSFPRFSLTSVVTFCINSLSRLVGMAISSVGASGLTEACCSFLCMISRFSRMLLMFAFSTIRSNGLTIYMSALVSKPRRISFLSPRAVSSIIGIWLVSISDFRVRHMVSPSMTDIITSDMIRSGCWIFILSMASCPFSAPST